MVLWCHRNKKIKNVKKNYHFIHLQTKNANDCDKKRKVFVPLSKWKRNTDHFQNTVQNQQFPVKKFCVIALRIHQLGLYLDKNGLDSPGHQFLVVIQGSYMMS